jgi:hypothetical protein
MSMYHGANPDPTITAPSGWTQLYQASTSTGGEHTVYFKFAEASEPDSYTWVLNKNKQIAAGVAAYRGVDMTSPFGAQTEAHVASQSSVSIDLTTAADGSHLLVFVAAKATLAGQTPEASLLERYDVHALERNLGLADEEIATSGSVSRTVVIDDVDGPDEIFAFAVALTPANNGPAAIVDATLAGVVTAPEADALSKGLKLLPAEFVLKPNYPNPARAATTIVFDLPEDAAVGVEIFDVLGRRALAIPIREMTSGYAREQSLDAGSLVSGTYVYVITATSGAGEIRRSSTFTVVK